MTATLVSYRWISFKDINGKRWSDFDNAAKCAHCGRAIVHVFTVRMDNGATVEVGDDHAHGLLGLPKPIRANDMAKRVARMLTDSWGGCRHTMDGAKENARMRCVANGVELVTSDENTAKLGSERFYIADELTANCLVNTGCWVRL
jgi:hypothetical protein